jgi:hypothetical protein
VLIAHPTRHEVGGCNPPLVAYRVVRTMLATEVNQFTSSPCPAR